MQTLLAVQGVSKRFSQTLAVDGVSFDVERGSCFGLLGPNGAGKTTTISMVIGSLTPDSGQITLDGEPFRPDHRRRIGYVPQDLALYDELSALDNLSLFGSLYCLAGADLKSRIDEALGIVGLTDRASDRVSKYSGGMKRRLNIAAALLHRPELLLLDEPTVGVDPQSRNAIFDTLRDLQAKGLTLIYTTHYMEEVEKLCDRIAILDSGKLVANDTLNGLYRLLPTHSVLTVQLEDGLGDAARNELATKAVHVSEEGGTLQLDLQDLASGVPAVTAVLERNAVRYSALQTRSATLEEVFLYLTGRSLRD